MLNNKQWKPLIFIIFVLVCLTLVKLFLEFSQKEYLPAVSELKGYRLVFHDEFDGTRLDDSKWGTCYDWYSELAKGCSNYGNDELEWYTAAQVSLLDGSLELKAVNSVSSGINKQGEKKAYPYTSGMISTGSAHSSTPRWMNMYGYYEARMKLPEGQGVWPAFWLLPEGEKWPPEIDIMELLGHEPDKVLMTYFWNDSPTHVAKDSFTHSSNTKFTESWHTYSVDWKPGSLDWYIDGKKVRGIKGRYVPSEKMSIVLNLAIGGRLPGNPDNSTKFPSTMKVDYVRVYKAQ